MIAKNGPFQNSLGAVVVGANGYEGFNASDVIAGLNDIIVGSIRLHEVDVNGGIGTRYIQALPRLNTHATASDLALKGC
jgi:hypothetical protein